VPPLRVPILDSNRKTKTVHEDARRLVSLGGPRLPLVLFLLRDFNLFCLLLPLSFGLVFLAFLVAHKMQPF